jgi:hypothetical protein
MSGFNDWGDIYANPGFELDELGLANSRSRLKAVLAMRPSSEGEAPSFELRGEPFALPERLDLLGTFYAPIPRLVVFYGSKGPEGDPHCWNMVALVRRLKDDPTHVIFSGEFDPRFNKDQFFRVGRLVPNEQTVAQLLLGRGHKFGVDMAFNVMHQMHRHVLAIKTGHWERLTAWLDVHLP